MKNKCMNMKSKFKKSSSMIKLIYEINSEKIITIFHPYFVKFNKNKCKMIINNKLYLLTDKYLVEDVNMKLLKIKLLILNNNKINFSLMFYECKSLKEFHVKSEEEEISKQEDKIENTKNIDSFDDFNNQSNIELLSSYNNNITNIFNEALNIYNKYNDFYKRNEKEKMNFNINLSNEFSLPSYSSIQNNIYIEYSSFNENSFSFKSWKKK